MTISARGARGINNKTGPDVPRGVVDTPGILTGERRTGVAAFSPDQRT
jgi:hypothetical protein